MHPPSLISDGNPSSRYRESTGLNHAWIPDPSESGSPFPNAASLNNLPHDDFTRSPSPGRPSTGRVGGPMQAKPRSIVDVEYDTTPRSFAGLPSLEPAPDSSKSRPDPPSLVALRALRTIALPLIVLDESMEVMFVNDAMHHALHSYSLSSRNIPLEEPPEASDCPVDLSIPKLGIVMLQEDHTTLGGLDRSLGPVDGNSEPVDERSPWSSAALETPAMPERKGPNEVVISLPEQDLSEAPNDEYSKRAKMKVTPWTGRDSSFHLTLSFTLTTPGLPICGALQGDEDPATPAQNLSDTLSSEEAGVQAENTSASPLLPICRSSHSSADVMGLPSVGELPFHTAPFRRPMSSFSIQTASHRNQREIVEKLTVMRDAIVDNPQVPILAMWHDGSISFPNKAACQLFRRKAHEFTPIIENGSFQWTGEVLWSEDFSRRLAYDEYPISILVRTRKPFTGRRVGLYGPHGGKMLFDVLGEAIRDEEDHFIAGVVTYRDVTNIAQEMRRIKEQDEDWFAKMCDSVPQFIWTATPDGSADFFNSRWYHYTGLTPEQSVGFGWQGSFHPDDIENTLERWHRCLETGEDFVVEYRCRRYDGGWRWFLGRASPLRNRDTGEITKWLGTCTDVNEGIETKLAANQTRDQLLRVLAHAHMTIFTVDTNRRVTMLEGSLLWQREEGAEESKDSQWFLGESMYYVFNRLNKSLPPGERPIFLESIESILDGKMGEVVKEHGIDGRWFRTRFIPLVSKDKLSPASESQIEGAIGLIMDVTELKLQEEKLEEEAKKKRQALSNEAAAKEANHLKSSFLANMSHEIRTPISGILGMAELLDSMLSTPEQREALTSIQNSARSLLTIINDILDFSKMESRQLKVDPEPFSVGDMVTNVGNMFPHFASTKKLHFDMIMDEDIRNGFVVIGDVARVRQVLTNLLINCIKFTPRGFVRFVAAKERESETEVEIKFTLEDSGIGINADVLELLCKPFSQGDTSTSRKFGGSGLGLTICKSLLDLMDGRMELESSPGVGTTAKVWIVFQKPTKETLEPKPITDAPDGVVESYMTDSQEEEVDIADVSASDLSIGSQRSLEVPPALSATKTKPPRSERSNLHILVVEDNPINQKIALRLISLFGFTVSAVWNGKEALDYIRAAQEKTKLKPSLILMDVQMPIIDGYKCTHILRHHEPFKTYMADIPIVALTASAIKGDREKCLKAGMDDYLAKPVQSKILESVLLHWTLSTRERPVDAFHAMGSSGSSVCSEVGDACDNSGIPKTEYDVDDGDEIFPELVDINRAGGRLSPITPRPLIISGSLDSEKPPWSLPGACEAPEAISTMSDDFVIRPRPCEGHGE